jgi:glutamate/tyrosine decarboxylase-like PLP-dependent enzyme
MFGIPAPALGHLTSSGTIANLEALWVAREVHPGKRIVHSSAAHYTHARMCELLGMTGTAVAPDPLGRLDLDAVEAECARGDVGTVVLTAGSTGLGAIDRVDEALALRERYGVRLHVDGAYGGFFTLLARGDDPLVAAAPYAAIAHCDSVVVDPHKHGLQPYGCGAVLFADPSVQWVYRHDSPFTYFTEADLHLGEISLECSRAGAAAAGLWLTLQALPLERDEGLGAVLAAGRHAALDWAARLRDSDVLALHVEPELDIVAYLPRVASFSALDAASEAVLKAGMDDPDDPVFLSTLYLGRDALAARHPALEPDADGARVLRSVLMKPEHEQAIDWLHERVEGLARAALA